LGPRTSKILAEGVSTTCGLSVGSFTARSTSGVFPTGRPLVITVGSARLQRSSRIPSDRSGANP